jgi:shikimate kinase
MKANRIVIVGFMGCGKTTVAQELSRQLGCDFVDLDSFISQREGRSPAEIIEQDGEAYFREVETVALQDVLQNHNEGVVALGGGTWTTPANRALAALHDCLSVWLDAPFELCWERILKSSSTVRPLAPDRETARHRYLTRAECYALTALRIGINEWDTPEAIVKNILSQT